jgi:hypothetical protein
MVIIAYWWKVSTALLGLCIMSSTEKMINTVFWERPAFQMAMMLHVEASTFIEKQAT